MAKKADKQLKKLSRQDLLEMLIEQTKSNEALTNENAELVSRLEKAEAELALRDELRSAIDSMEQKLDEIKDIAATDNTPLLDKLSTLEEKTELLTEKISQISYSSPKSEEIPQEKDEPTVAKVSACPSADEIIAKIIADRNNSRV